MTCPRCQRENPPQAKFCNACGARLAAICPNDLRMDYTAVGQTTHLAARMEQLAAPGSIRLTAETLHLAEGFVQVTALGPVPVKGLAEPVEVFELVGAGAAREMDMRFWLDEVNAELAARS